MGNALRTLTYLRRGLGGPDFVVSAEATTAPTGDVTGDIYTDVYGDIYTGEYVLDHWTPQGLACYCAAYDTSPYVSPAADDAPWYAPQRPESADFLGFIPFEILVQPSVARGVVPGQMGSALGPVRAGGQIMAVNGHMYAASRAGMAYGERWLTDVLTGGLCGDDPDLVFLPACPLDPDDVQWRTMRRVGLVDGPVFGRIEGVPACSQQPASFQLASESPWLVSDPIVLAQDAPLITGAIKIVEATTADWVGDAAIRLTATVGQAYPAVFFWYGYISETGDCNAGAVRPCWEWHGLVPAGHQIVIDGVERTIEIRNPATGEVVGGMESLTTFSPSYQGPFVWPEVGPCSTVCVACYANAAPSGTVVTIEQFGREL